ncbi:MAG TPA: SagB family peptide dehydrogenase, partial [Gammaproteobacteria bacterium]|nr:SagB family peptide dehydrogenase [Gammaproteobacteria bacterium]
TGDRFTCSQECLAFLAQLDDWQPAEKLFDCFPDAERTGLAEQLAHLVECNALVAEGTPQATLDEHYRQEWQWGTVAGFYHFGVRDTPFVDGPATREFLQKRRQWRPSPPLHQSNKDALKIVPLPKTDLRQEPFALMRRRRSQRRFLPQSMSLETLSDCLFAGNGILEFFDDEDFGHLPITMTPSGGARNPFELYVYARNVDGLAPGFYHYAALEHDLGLVRAGEVRVQDMLGGQDWPAQAAAIVFLVAHFPRSMWKYPLGAAYRVVLMEAGFIGQNIALAATHHGLSAIPSGAFKESLIESCLGTPAIETGVLLSLSLGVPEPEQDSHAA